MIIGGIMDDKISVNIREAENGYIVTRCYHMKPKKGKDYGEYKEEPFIMKTLPKEMAKLFDKKGIKEMANKSSKKGWEEAETSAKAAFK